MMRDLSEEKAVNLNGGIDDVGDGDADREDSEDSQRTVVFRTPRASKGKIEIKEERERSASTPPVVRVSRWADGNIINIKSTSESHHSRQSPDRDSGDVGTTVQVGAAQRQEDHVVAPHYGNIAQSVQPHIFLHLLARKEHQQGGSKEIAQAILQLHDLGVSAGPGEVNNRPLQRIVQEVADEAGLQAEDDRSKSMEKTIEGVFSLKNDFQGFESDRDQQ